MRPSSAIPLLDERIVTEPATSGNGWKNTPPAEMVAAAAGAVAHDLNNLLTAVIASLDLAISAADLPASAQEDLANARASAFRSAELVNRLRNFARAASASSGILGVAELMETSGAILRKQFGPKIAVESWSSGDGLWLGRGDSEQWRQVILNVAARAQEGLENGGVVRLTARNWTGEIPGSSEQEFIVIEVEDSGKPRHILEALEFDARGGVRRDFVKSAGLGFFMARASATWQGGWVAQESTATGNRYRVFVPRATEGISKPAEEATPVARRARTILVVDDDGTTRWVIRSLLEFQGFRVLEAANGEQALAACRAGGALDLMLLDLEMPGTDGWGVLRQLAGGPERPRVLLMSHCLAEGLSLREIAGEIGGVLKKPFERETLFSAVRRALETGAEKQI